MICSNCFGDFFLADHINTKAERTIKFCDYCSSNNVKCISPSKLFDVISPLLNLYFESNDADAKPLFFYLRQDWALLLAPTDNNCIIILDSIFPEEFISKKKFQSKRSKNSRIDLLVAFQNELKYENRFFPKTKIIDIDDLKNLFTFLIYKNIPKNYFRARICTTQKPFTSKKMGKPPLDNIKGGRANPIGISYLYTASNEATAIAEVRPSPGDYVSVAKFHIQPAKLKNLSLLDLRNPRETISPFAIEEDELLTLLNELDFLCKLGEQLSKTILPKEADLEYLASQYLCEMIKHFGYDGVVYKSSLEKGFNIAFFNEEKLTISKEVRLFHVSGVKYTAEEVNN